NLMKVQQLKDRINNLISHYTHQKNQATQINQQLFTKLNSLKELEALEKLPSQFLTAYLLYRQAFYSNYQKEHLQQANFDRESYLNRLEKEIEIVETNLQQELLQQIEQEIINQKLQPTELVQVVNRALQNQNNEQPE